MENFIVSARKYRPITFESVVGQNHITSTLKNAIINHQLAHAYLFCGPRGVGKTTCARILAKSINCLNPSPTAEPCGVCESCIAFSSQRSFNIHELDAASNNSVNDIRSLTEQVRIPPQIGKYSIYIIDEAHMLSTSAFNAFLKTLEEPPAHAIFILATTEKHKLIPTILSRCQIYDFKRIKQYDLVEFLKFITQKESVTYDDESLHMIAEKADGCMRDALSMYDKVVSFCGPKLEFKRVAESLNILDYDTYFNFTDLIKGGDYAGALLLFDEVLQKGFDSQIFLSGLSTHLRNVLVAKSDRTCKLLEVTGRVAERYAKQASETNVPFIFDSLSIISLSEASVRQSSSQRLHTELTILKMCNLSPLKISSGSIQESYSLPQITPDTSNQLNRPVNNQQQQVTPTPSGQNTSTQNHAPQVKPTIEPSEKKNSKLGFSIKNIVAKKSKQEESDKIESSEKGSIADEIKLNPEDYEKIKDAAKEFSSKINNSRPRIASIFENSEIVDGKLHLKVANDIAREEILTEKHLFLNEISTLCGIKGIDMTIDVVAPEEQPKTLLVRDQDKLKHLIDLNPDIIELCKTLDLDYT